jgi:hypothetical protein
VANGYILKSSCILPESTRSNACVATGGVVKEYIHPDACVFIAPIVSKRKCSDRGVKATVGART